MKYRVVLDLSFDDKSDADEILGIAGTLKSKAASPFKNLSLNMSSITIEKKVELWECYHDEDPPKQCKRII